ncbi:hypothetical protein Tco_1222523 [Tanacetum coccineum]
MQICSLWFPKFADLLPNFTKVQTASPKRNLCRIHAPWQGARVQWKFQFLLHSYSLAGSTSAMKVSNWGGHLHFREVEESWQNGQAILHGKFSFISVKSKKPFLLLNKSSESSSGIDNAPDEPISSH